MYLLCFFFSSRRRHTRYWRDWSSDVCSSDLNSPSSLAASASSAVRCQARPSIPAQPGAATRPRNAEDQREDRKSVVEGKGEDLGGRRVIKKNNTEFHTNPYTVYLDYVLMTSF